MRILFLAPIRHLASIQFATQSIQAFAKKGYNVDVITSSLNEPEYKSTYSKVRVINYKDKKRLFDILYFSFFQKVRLYRKINSFDVVIGLSQKGLIGGVLLLSKFKKHIIYMSDEIWDGHEGKSWYKKIYNWFWKAIERHCNAHVDFSITQDSKRAELLAKVNRINLKSIMCLPNSSSGKAERKKSKYLQKRFNIPPETNILLSIGMIPENSGNLELAKEAIKWSSEFRLVFHLRHTINPKKDLYAYNTIQIADNKRVYASLTPVSYENLINIVASSKIGLALYGDKNLRETSVILMGYSSGKVCLYLKLGIPVIVQDFSGFKWVEESGAGICVSKPEEVLKAAKKIIANYDFYSKNALKTFEKRLNFDRAFEKIENKIKEMLIKK